MPHADVRHGQLHRVALVVDDVRLEQARGSLGEGVDPRAVPVEEHLLAVQRARRERHPVRDVLLVRTDGDRIEVGLLERHPAAAEGDRRDGVAVHHGEKVEVFVVEVLDVLAVELRLHGRAEQLVRERDRFGRHLVVDRVGRRREEEVVRAHLVRVDVHHAGVLAQQLELRVRLALGPREPVAVHVEEVGVLPLLGLAAVGVLRRDDPDERVIEDLLRGAVGAVGELVEDTELGVCAALLVPVDVAHQPQDRRRLRSEPGGLGGRCLRIAQARRRLADRREASGRHMLGLADERVAEVAALPGGAEDAADDPGARRVDGLHVFVGLGSCHLLRAEREAELRLGRRHLSEEGRRRLYRVAGSRQGRTGRRGRAGEEGEDGGEEHEQRRTTHRG